MGELADKLRYAMQDGTIRTEILGTAKLILEGSLVSFPAAYKFAVIFAPVG